MQKEWVDAQNGTWHIQHAQDFAEIPGLRRLCLSRALFTSLSRQAPTVDIFHSHGLWLMPNVYPAWVARTYRRPLIISPRGMLAAAAMRFSPAKKRIFWHVLQKAAIDQASCLHATSEKEYDEIRAIGLLNPVAVIPNGIDVPELDKSNQCERMIISLGRIHPKKGLDRLVRAWAALESSFPPWRLRIVGPDELGYTKKLKQLAKEHGLTWLSFEGPLYGSEQAFSFAGRGFVCFANNQ